MRRRPNDWGPSHGPGRRIGFRVFGFLFFLLMVSAAVGGFLTWVVSPNPGTVLLVGFGLIVAFALTMRTVFRRSWAPVSQLIDATTRLGEGDTSVRLSGRRGPWQGVSRSFNAMAERIAAEDERRRRLLAEVGHEMRNPLSVIQGEIEAVLDGVHPPESLNNVVDEVALMDRLLEDLRTLALAEAGRLELIREPTDIGQLASDVLASFTSQISEQQVQASVSGTAEMTIDPHRIHQVLANLVANALRQMPDGGELTISIGEGSLRVADSGPGIPKEELETVFERFTKASDSKGSGLGLSIARDLVEAHGGTLTAANGTEGGAVFEITLP